MSDPLCQPPSRGEAREPAGRSEAGSPSAAAVPLRIAVADHDPSIRDYLQEALTRLGHQVCAAQGGRQLVELCRLLPPDLVIVDVRMADLDGIDAAREICRERPTPVILLSAYHDAPLLARAGEGEVLAFLVKPIKQGDLAAAIPLAVRRFQTAEAKRRETADLRQALEDRKLIERAKGVVSKRTGADEETAYRRLRKLSSNRNAKLIEIARMVLAAEETFQLLETQAAGRPESGGRRPARVAVPASDATDEESGDPGGLAP